MKPSKRLAALIFAGAIQSTLATTPVSAVGPVAPWAGHVIVDQDGVQATGRNYAPLADDSIWQPQWFTAVSADASSTVWLKRDIVVAPGAMLKTATARLSGDRAYRLWVNGQLVARGPDDAGSDVGETLRWTHQWLYNSVDLAPFLKPGSNLVAVQVVNASSSSALSLGTTGFAFEARLGYADGRSEAVAGPAGWTGVANRAYTDGALVGVPGTDGLRYDAALEPDDWPQPTVRQAWSSVIAIDSVWGALRATHIPTRMEAVFPATTMGDIKGSVQRDPSPEHVDERIAVRGDSTFTLRFGRVISAYLAMQVEGAAGTVITLVPKETSDQGPPMRPLQVTLRGGVTTWESPGYDSFSEVQVQVSHASRPVSVRFLKAVFTSQPVVYRGSFESSDDHLNALWKAARWQTQISMQDRYLDSPNHQEPIGDPGDYLIAAQESDYAFGDPWMAAQNLRQFAALLDRNGEVTFHASYPLFWVQMLVQYYRQTGDRAMVRELAPSVDRLLAHLRTYLGSDGLMSEAPNYMFMDWIKVEGYNLHHPPAVIGEGYFTALYYQGLKDGATLAALTGDAAKARHYTNEATALAGRFDRELWDEKAGLYRDGKPFRNHQPLAHYFPADRDIETHTDQVNILATLHGLASPARGREIMETLLARPRLDVQPYFMSFAFAAEAAVGLWDRAAWSQMQQWHLNPQTGTFREMWFNGDWSHTWGGSPLVQLSSRVLGVTPEQPGYAVVRIAPHRAGLEWAKGVVPTPAGNVSVDWKHVEKGMELDVSSPVHMPIVLDLSFVRDAGQSVTIDGADRAPDASGTYRLAPGSHVVVTKDVPKAPPPSNASRDAPASRQTHVPAAAHSVGADRAG